jgi:hypothetical protein
MIQNPTTCWRCYGRGRAYSCMRWPGRVGPPARCAECAAPRSRAPGGRRGWPRRSRRSARGLCCVDEGALSFVTAICFSYGDFPYKIECGRENCSRPSSKLAEVGHDGLPAELPPPQGLRQLSAMHAVVKDSSAHLRPHGVVPRHCPGRKPPCFCR